MTSTRSAAWFVVVALDVGCAPAGPPADLYTSCTTDDDCNRDNRGGELADLRCEPPPGGTPGDAVCTKTCDIFAGQDSADGHNFDSPVFCEDGVCFVDEAPAACSDADADTPCQVSGSCIATAATE